MAHVLVLGNGGREHALAWSLARGASVSKVSVAPGNGGTAAAGGKIANVDVDPANFDALVAFCTQNNVELVVVGPEQPLVDGVVDRLSKSGIACFGPSKRAAQLEGSKAFSKAFMQRHGIPTAKYEVFTDLAKALAYVRAVSFRVVIKASGLAAGKGVVLPTSVAEAEAALTDMMEKKVFGAAGAEVVIEEFLEGEEVSMLAFTDGYTIVGMPPAQDHKRVFDNDEGPNTGGMGAYAPAPVATPILLKRIQEEILKPTIDSMRKDGIPYVGVLYAGLMITASGPKVLEYNCRFGDPETQAILPLLDDATDLAQVMLACVERRLDSVNVSFRQAHSVTVVVASEGYPNAYPKGVPIAIGTGLSATALPCTVFHAGTATKDGKLVTSGGRILAVSAVGPTLRRAVDAAYEGVAVVDVKGSHHRKDIAHRALRPAVQKSVTYADSGVDVDRGDHFVDLIKPLARATRRTGCDAELGGFGGLFDLMALGYKDPVLVSGTDGVGTKLRVAQIAGIHNTVGIDLVAMSVNDLVVQGAEPLFFLDYYATSHIDTEIAVKVVEGISKGCIDSGCGLLGGETAEMPGMYMKDDYDLAGFAVGAVERTHLLPKKLSTGDIVLGVPSAGLHSNGFSLVRHLMTLHGLDYAARAPFSPPPGYAATFGKNDSCLPTIGECFLVPTRLYAKSCVPLAQRGLVLAMAHITGGGLYDNIPRFLADDQAVVIDAAKWPIPDMFLWLAKLGNIVHTELGRTLNCGIGMVLVAKAADVPAIRAHLATVGETCYEIGTVTERTSPAARQVEILNTETAWKHS